MSSLTLSFMEFGSCHNSIRAEFDKSGIHMLAWLPASASSLCLDFLKQFWNHLLEVPFVDLPSS